LEAFKLTFLLSGKVTADASERRVTSKQSQ
jgi:hypothetical protein